MYNESQFFSVNENEMDEKKCILIGLVGDNWLLISPASLSDGFLYWIATGLMYLRIEETKFFVLKKPNILIFDMFLFNWMIQYLTASDSLTIAPRHWIPSDEPWMEPPGDVILGGDEAGVRNRGALVIICRKQSSCRNDRALCSVSNGLIGGTPPKPSIAIKNWF